MRQLTRANTYRVWRDVNLRASVPTTADRGPGSSRCACTVRGAAQGLDACDGRRTPQEFEKTCLITSVPQPSKSVSLRGWPATAELMGRGTRTDPTAALTTPPG